MDELSWLIGIVEGEGTIALTGKFRRAIRITVELNDKDVVERVAALWGTPIHHRTRTRYWRRLGKSVEVTTYNTSVCGYRARKFLRVAAPFMSARRKLRIADALSTWPESEEKDKTPFTLYKMEVANDQT